MNYTYQFKWELRNAQAPWLPRCGMGFISQRYPNTALGYRLVFLGGYGGLLNQKDPKFDGLRSRGDVWTTENGLNWTLLSSQTAFGELAWMGSAVWEPSGDGSTSTVENPRIWIVGGGYIGDYFNKRVSSMIGSVNVFWSKDGIEWNLVNFVSGGGKSEIERYSSNEWTKTTIDGDLYFLGLWGLTLEVMTVSTETGAMNKLFMLGGDQDGGGTYQGVVYEGEKGLVCDLEGMVCNGK
jgi:hypothetical protein